MGSSPSRNDKDAEWARYIADMQQLQIDRLNGEPPTDDLCIEYAENAIRLPFPWYQVLRDGILENKLLRPIIDRVLSYLVLQFLYM